MKRKAEVKFELTPENVNKSLGELREEILGEQIREIEKKYAGKIAEIEKQKGREIEKLRESFSIPYILVPNNLAVQTKKEVSVKPGTGKRGRPRKGSAIPQ